MATEQETPVETVVTPDTQENIPVLNEISDPEHGGYIGQCKWFNDKLGYGFITICDGDKKGKDIFVHHSGIKPQNSNYKTLRKGEYINFNIINGMNGLQAVDITGINGGPLMCDVVQGPPTQPFVPHQMPPPPQGWQTVPVRKPLTTYSRPPVPPQPQKPYQKRVKNTNKYNKETRGKPMTPSA